MYGDSEVLLGKWFKKTGKRDQVRENWLESMYQFFAY